MEKKKKMFSDEVVIWKQFIFKVETAFGHDI